MACSVFFFPPMIRTGPRVAVRLDCTAPSRRPPSCGRPHRSRPPYTSSPYRLSGWSPDLNQTVAPFREDDLLGPTRGVGRGPNPEAGVLSDLVPHAAEGDSRLGGDRSYPPVVHPTASSDGTLHQPHNTALGLPGLGRGLDDADAPAV